MNARWLSWCLALACLWNAPLFAEDWPGFMGAKRDSVWRETGIVEKFPEGGPKVVWRTKVGLGYSGPAVAEGRVFVQDYLLKTGSLESDPGTRNVLAGTERVLCLDAKNGKKLWEYKYDRPYQISYPSGPRATPTVDDDRVYTLGAEGDLYCLNVENGKVIWEKHFNKDYTAPTPIWGFCSHPLVYEDLLITLVGGEGSVAVAFDKMTGEEVWRALSAPEPGYCPPTLIEAGGVTQLLVYTPVGVHGLDPRTGKVHWAVSIEPDYGMSIAAPRRSGDFLFASGIGDVGVLIKLDPKQPAAEEVWRGTNKTSVPCANSTPFIDAGTIYGCDCKTGQFRAVDVKTGKRLWDSFAPTTNGRRAGHGTAFIVKNEDRYFLMSETGDLIIAKLTPKAYTEVSRIRLLKPTGDAFGRPVVWSHPAFANQSVYARNDEEIVCVSLKN